MNAPFQLSGKSVLRMRLAAPGVRRLWPGSIVVIAWLGLLVMNGARAMDIPPLSVIQVEIAAAHPELVKQRGALLKERKALFDKTNSHNKSCAEVEAGSAAEASCSKALATLTTVINSHVLASRQYNGNYLTAVNRTAKPESAPGADASVVDARNVPSGLSKSVENAIVSAYSDAAPGVSDRVRKGFQAVMDRDWKVAKAWFEDAFNRDPGNANLKRLVALVGQTPEVKKQIPRSHQDSAPARWTLASLNASASTMSTEQIMKALEDITADNVLAETLGEIK